MIRCQDEELSHFIRFQELDCKLGLKLTALCYSDVQFRRSLDVKQSLGETSSEYQISNCRKKSFLSDLVFCLAMPCAEAMSNVLCSWSRINEGSLKLFLEFLSSMPPKYAFFTV